MEKPSIKALLLYIEGALDQSEMKKIDAYLDRFPDYQRIVNALQLLKNRLGSDEQVLQFLQRQKDDFIKKAFG